MSLQAQDGTLQARPAAVIRAGSLQVRTGGGIGLADAPVQLSVDRLGAVAHAGGIHVREADGLRLSGVGLRVETGPGDITVAVDAGDLAMDVAAAVATAGGRIDLAVHGDAGIAQLLAGEGAIRLRAGGAISAHPDQGAPDIATRGLLVLEANNGIGGFGAAQLRVEAGELRARNARGGNVVIFGERGLWVGESGVRSGAPSGYVVLLSDTGAVQTGHIEALSGRIVMMSGYASLTETQVAGIHWMLLQRGVHNASLAVRGNLPVPQPAAWPVQAGPAPSDGGPLWLDARPGRLSDAAGPAEATRMLTATALHLLSFSAPPEPDGTETLPMLMTRAPARETDDTGDAPAQPAVPAVPQAAAAAARPQEADDRVADRLAQRAGDEAVMAASGEVPPIGR